MNKIKKFVDKNKEFDTLEGELARAYIKAVADRDFANRELMKTVRYEKFGNKYLPYFQAEYEKPLLAENAAERKIAVIENDIKRLIKAGKDAKGESLQK